MLFEKLRRPAPGELRRRAIVHRHPLLIAEAVLGVIAEDLQRLAGGLHALLEGVDQRRRAPVVLGGEMRLQRNFHIRRLCRLLRRDAVKHHARGEFRDFGGADDGHRAAEAEAGEADLGAVAAEILHGAAHGLRGGVHEIQRVHLFAGGIGVVIGHHLALVEIGRQGVEAGQREAVAHALDLILQPPPFLDHHHTRRVAAGGVGEIAAGVLAVRTLEADAGAHGFLLRFSGADWRLFWLLWGRDAIVLAEHDGVLPHTLPSSPDERICAHSGGARSCAPRRIATSILRGSPKGARTSG